MFSNPAYSTICGLAERHQASALAAACARFVAEEVEAPDWAAIEQAPIVATAIAWTPRNRLRVAWDWAWNWDASEVTVFPWNVEPLPADS